jgi:hypothetical protein
MNDQTTGSARSTFERGGLRWPGLNATKPFATLSVDEDGISVEPSGRTLAFMGVPPLQFRWEEVRRVWMVRGAIPFPDNVGVAFAVSRRLIFWCSRDQSAAICDRVREHAPGRLETSARRRLVF